MSELLNPELNNESLPPEDDFNIDDHDIREHRSLSETGLNSEAVYDALVYAKSGKFEEFKALVEDFELSVDSTDADGSSFLLSASFGHSPGNLLIVNYLLEKGADINYTNKIDWSALNAAVEVCNYEIVKTLVSNPNFKISFDSKDQLSYTVFDYLIQKFDAMRQAKEHNLSYLSQYVRYKDCEENESPDEVANFLNTPYVPEEGELPISQLRTCALNILNFLLARTKKTLDDLDVSPETLEYIESNSVSKKEQSQAISNESSPSQLDETISPEAAANLASGYSEPDTPTPQGVEVHKEHAEDKSEKKKEDSESPVASEADKNTKESKKETPLKSFDSAAEAVISNVSSFIAAAVPSVKSGRRPAPIVKGNVNYLSVLLALILAFFNLLYVSLS